MEEGRDTVDLHINRTNLLQLHYLNASTADVFFICTDGSENDENDAIKERIPAHKIILASMSSVFQTMFFGQLPEKTEIEITDVTGEGLKQFLHLFYTEKVICTTDHVHEVLYMAEKYDVPDCSIACSKFLMKRGHESFKTTNFLHCSQTILRTILQNVYLKGEGEVLFKACMDWALMACSKFQLDGNMKNRRTMLGDCLDLIEFTSIKRTTAIEYLKDYPSLFKVNDSTFERVKTYDDKNSQWPFYSGYGSVDVEKGKPYRLQFEADRSCLLHDIAFCTNDIEDMEGNDKDFTLLVSIEKTLPADKKTKIFVGTLSFTFDLLDESISATLPDVIVIDPLCTYIIEVITFEDMRFNCNVGPYYELNGKTCTIIVFQDPNFARLKITII